MVGRQSMSFEIFKDTVGIVQNAEIAVELAKVIIRSQYGDDEIAKQAPYAVSEEDGVWTIKGSRVPILPTPNGDGSIPITPDMHGPVEVDIRKSSGEILFFECRRHLSTEWRPNSDT